MVNVIVVNGYPRSGKDTFVNFCKEKLGAFGVSVSTVDFVKYLAAQSGWDGTKTPKNRKFLSDLKDLLTEWNDVPWKKVEEVFESIKVECFQYGLRDSDFFLFVHSREPKEIERFQKEYGALTILIDREEVEGKQSNHSDAEVMNFNYDYIINNDGTLEELKMKAMTFIESVRLTNKNKENLTPYDAENGKEEE
jgi:dephospho-CoA kinase